MKRFLFVLIILSLFCSCVKEVFIGEGDSSKTIFKLKPIMYYNIVPTKAGVGVDENKINDIWVLQFNGQVDGSTLVKAVYSSSVPDINNLGIKLENGTGQRVLFVINSGNSELFNNANAEIGVFTYSDFKGKSFPLFSEDDNFIGADNVLKMFGEYLGDIPNVSSPEVEIRRLCAKVVLNYTSIESLDIFNPGQVKIKSVQLKNVPASAPFFVIANNSAPTAPSFIFQDRVISGTNTGTGTSEPYSISDYSGNITYYMTENISGVIDGVTPKNRADLAPEKATYLELVGEYYLNQQFLKYVKYKVYLGSNNSTNFNVESNKSYTINVTFKGIDITDSRIVTEDNPWGALAPVVINGLIWAPVNAGYSATTPYGLLYQWHRKYGQDQKPALLNENVLRIGKVPLDVANSVANSGLFFGNDIIPNYNPAAEWCTIRQPEWSMSSKYNPCPVGWRVPTYSELDLLITSGSTWTSSGLGSLPGRWFGGDHSNTHVGSVFLPASGYNGYDNASTDLKRGTYGYYWASDLNNVSTDKAYYLRYQTDQSIYMFTNCRSYGFAVRCVKSTDPIAPILSTDEPVLDLANGSATVGGNVEYAGYNDVIEKGFVYGTGINPTTANSKITSGSGAGTFSATITGLTENYTYYIRSYAINTKNQVFYGNEQTFTFSILFPGTYRYAVLMNGNLYWAPVNSGFSLDAKFGSLYQWHRKYGQNYTSPGATTTSATYLLSYGNDIANKDVFFKITTSPNDWCSTSQASWDMADGYNPCPTGWRVPTSAELTSIRNSYSNWIQVGEGGDYNLPGRWFGGNHSGDHIGSIFLPGAGYINFDGIAKERSTTPLQESGRYWSVTADFNYATDLTFTNSTAPIIGTGSRGVGRSVRCVKTK